MKITNYQLPIQMYFFTIGVYHSTEEQFFQKLKDHQTDTFCDIRQRRGVRGAEYAFANSNRLQARLGEMGIRYLHITELAPTTDMRELQYEKDEQLGVGKRDRTTLSQSFATAYQERILNRFDFNAFIRQLTDLQASQVVLFCVEEKAEACHRSIVAERLKHLGYPVRHL